VDQHFSYYEFKRSAADRLLTSWREMVAGGNAPPPPSGRVASAAAEVCESVNARIASSFTQMGDTPAQGIQV
jgi:hypothetical protein